MPAFDKSTLLLAKPVPGEWSFKCEHCRYKVASCGQLFAESKGLKHAIKYKHDVKVTDMHGNTEVYQYATLGVTGPPPY